MTETMETLPASLPTSPHPNPDPYFQIGSLPVYGDLILAPMSGFSDQPFRSLCRELGSAMSYTGFVNVLDVLQGSPEVAEQLAYLPEERPVVFQIFDNDPQRLLEVALRLQERGPDAIDINLGCSTRRVSGRGAGAGLLRSPLKIARIFRVLSTALEVPVTGKIRLGWDEDCRNYLLVARIIQEQGGALVAVHGRTRQQGYTDQADWEAIAEVCQAVSIPVIGNGDVRSLDDIQRLKAFTGCQGVMIGRGAVGNPWIFSRLDRGQVSPDQVRATMLEHLARMQAFYGPERGLVLFRKHTSRYLSPYPLPDHLRRQMLTANDPEVFQVLIDKIFNSMGEPA